MEGENKYAHDAYVTLGDVLSTITAYFNFSESFPKVRVVLVPDRKEFDRLVRELLHVEIEYPSDPARIAQPQRTYMVVLSPSAYERHSIFRYIPDDFRRLLIHELVHMVEEYLSPNIEALPRWWSEGLAVYLSKQWQYEDGFRKPVLEAIKENKIPQITQIRTDRNLAYDWGWTIVRFIENVYGREIILKIVKQCADGDILSLLNEKIDRLDLQWRNWLQTMITDV